MSTKRNNNNLFDDLRPQIEHLQKLQEDLESQWRTRIEAMERSGTRDIAEIEQILDYLLGWAEFGDSLLLYKRICRYLWSFAPENAAAYVYAWREMWDEDSLDDEEK